MTDFVAFGMIRPGWEGRVLGTSSEWRLATNMADAWLAFQAGLDEDAAAGVIDVRPGATSIDYRAIGWAPLDLPERLEAFAERVRQDPEAYERDCRPCDGRHVVVQDGGNRVHCSKCQRCGELVDGMVRWSA